MFDLRPLKRLKSILSEIITSFQNAFIKGSQISDNVILALELLNLIKKKKRKGKLCIRALELDTNKAHDRLNLNFV
ncbi:hypothetical protein J1N35_010470 [Gossypium stocksii]|uniref:Reverse transcriptase domain-containing protein n=1 Tax=Gossypium stocksii TaxID=47602 RepID=A0A9D3W123_9ROSI|nr:hypothetical protein J1N35_010470 [Gossypium stocksii]